MRIRRPPSWVRNIPYQADREALLQVFAISAGPFDKPREINYTLTGFTDQQSIENAVYTIEREGWMCRIEPTADDEAISNIVCQKLDYRLTQEAYYHDSAFFNRIARMYDAEYDGWYAMGHTRRRWFTLPIILATVRLAICFAIFIVIGWRNYSDVSNAAIPSTVASQSATTASLSPPAVNTPLKTYDPTESLKTYTSSDVGVSFQYPESWVEQDVGVPCETLPMSTGFNKECDVELTPLHTSGEAPVIRIVRLHNTLEQIESLTDAWYARGIPNAKIIKQHSTLDGHPALRYTMTDNGNTYKLLYIESGGKVFGLEGTTPVNAQTLSRSDYLKIYDTVASSYKVL